MIPIILSFMTILISCQNATNSNLTDDKVIVVDEKKRIEATDIDLKSKDDSNSGTQIQLDLKATQFIKSLEGAEKLSSFFNDSWILIYHEDNRCEGSTDGQTDSLKSREIDLIIKLQVKNDGNGWTCDKKEPRTYGLDFDLKQKIANWDRLEILNYENKEKNIIYVGGAGESDYIKLHYDDKDLIVKLEYRSEDPG